MRHFYVTLLLFVILTTAGAQKKLERTLKKFNTESVPYIHVDDLKKLEDPLLFDAREKEEFAVSRLKNALWIGHQTFNIDSVQNKVEDKDREIVVYCSIGVRSELIGEKLAKAGFTNVKNLYGGIFEWKNRGNPVYGPQGNTTEDVHAFDQQWGKLLNKGNKVYQAPSAMVEH